MNTLLLPADDPQSIQKALETLERGGLVAFPTDTIYGVGALAFQEQAVQELYAAKGRSEEKAIPILISDAAELAKVARDVRSQTARLGECFWPGALTIVVGKHPGLPEAVSATATVGVRVPNHGVALALLRNAGPMAVTSANLSGQPGPTTAEGVLAQLGGRIALVLDGGKTPGGVASTVVDCTGNEVQILREGPITLEMIQECING